MSAKSDARSLQRYTGSSYMTCLRWVRTIREEGLDKAEQAAGGTDREKNLRVALHKRFPDVVIERDEEQP
jgi:transposase